MRGAPRNVAYATATVAGPELYVSASLRGQPGPNVMCDVAAGVIVKVSFIFL